MANAESSEARYTHISAISPALPSRPIGWRAMKSLRACTGSANALILPCSDGVSTVPGQMALQRMPLPT